MINVDHQASRRAGCLLLSVLAFVAACSDLPPPNDEQAIAIVRQYVDDSKGIVEIHEALGYIYVYRPNRINRAATKKCQVIANDAFWCEFEIDFSTADQSSVTGALSFRVETENGQYRAVLF